MLLHILRFKRRAHIEIPNTVGVSGRLLGALLALYHGIRSGCLLLPVISSGKEGYLFLGRAIPPGEESGDVVLLQN
jgi:hypothetical protein